jgi:16S rRNA G966 N2-methylase RsmD
MDLNKINKIFPQTEDNHKLLYDEEGLWSITLPKEAAIITKIILNEVGSNKKILDGTAGLGGNTISFANHFEQVVSIELNPERYNLLKNNVNIYNLSNVVLINDSSVNYLKNNFDGYFFDPPWGGPEYKSIQNLKINLGQLTLKEVIHIIKSSHPHKKIFFKVPNNYDLNEFSNFNYKIYKVKNYQIITIYT